MCVCVRVAPLHLAFIVYFPSAEQNDLTFHVTSRTTNGTLFQAKGNIHGNQNVCCEVHCVYAVIIHLMKINEGITANSVGSANTGRVLRLGASASKQTISF